MQMPPAVHTVRFAPCGTPPAHLNLPDERAPTLAPGHAACATCMVRHVCLPSWTEPGTRTTLDRTPIARRRLRKGQSVFREGERCEFIFAVRYGSFKSVTCLRDGREQVMSFHLPGELFGFDGLATGMHPTSARAIEDAEVCVLPYAELSEAAGESPSVLHHLTSTLSAELVRERHLASLIAATRSEERVAAFLLNLSQRLQARGYSASAFQLRMTREEIGSYLGATLETVSRCLSSLARQGFVTVRRRQIEILDPEGLRASFADPV